ncbi:MAG: PaaI family thioesterase [Planctomycetales bacterium]|nr:PaaI family thioesterase [Planctomycetales bacterium]MCA9166746.1 PaaI family thioesterase [Planctomycetales bacterium]
MKKHRVVAKQPNSKMCLVCGLENIAGLRASFYELEDEQLGAVFTPQDNHQGYPGRLHGGIAAALLDETIGRAIRMRHGDELWGVTIELTTRYRKPVPLNEPIRAVSRINKETRRHFEGTGEILLADGTVAVEAHGRYFKMLIDMISDFDPEQQQWRVVPHDSDPPHFEFVPHEPPNMA